MINRKDIMTFTDAEEYILSNLPNGSDIDDDIRDLGQDVVDALADKLFAKATEIRNAVAKRQASARGEVWDLGALIECVLFLQRMKRFDRVKQLMGIRRDHAPTTKASKPADIKLTKNEEWMLVNLMNGSAFEDEEKEFGPKAMDVLATKLHTQAAIMKADIGAQERDSEEARKAMRKFLGLVRQLTLLKRPIFVKQLLGY